MEQSSDPTDMMLMLILIAGILPELLYWSRGGQLSLEGNWGGGGKPDLGGIAQFKSLTSKFK